jgi:hypothetical protein
LVSGAGSQAAGPAYGAQCRHRSLRPCRE